MVIVLRLRRATGDDILASKVSQNMRGRKKKRDILHQISHTLLVANVLCRYYTLIDRGHRCYTLFLPTTVWATIQGDAIIQLTPIIFEL